MSNKKQPSKKSKKHDVSEIKKKESKYQFLNSHEFIWNGYEWTVPSLGGSWFLTLRNKLYVFRFVRFDTYGFFRNWYIHDEWRQRYTSEDYKEHIVDGILQAPKSLHNSEYNDYMIVRTMNYPNQEFIRSWLDRWIEYESVIIWDHIGNTERFINGKDEKEADKIALKSKLDFLKLFE